MQVFHAHRKDKVQRAGAHLVCSSQIILQSIFLQSMRVAVANEGVLKNGDLKWQRKTIMENRSSKHAFAAAQSDDKTNDNMWVHVKRNDMKGGQYARCNTSLTELHSILLRLPRETAHFVQKYAESEDQHGPLVLAEQQLPFVRGHCCEWRSSSIQGQKQLRWNNPHSQQNLCQGVCRVSNRL